MYKPIHTNIHICILLYDYSSIYLADLAGLPSAYPPTS